MKPSTAYNHSVKFRSIMADILRHARSAAMSHDDILKERQRRLYDLPAWHKVPQWARNGADYMFESGMRALCDVSIGAADLDRREAQIRAGLPVEPLPYVRWFLTYTDESGQEIHCTEWGELPQAVRDSAAIDGDGCLFRGAHRWNHRRDRVY